VAEIAPPELTVVPVKTADGERFRLVRLYEYLKRDHPWAVRSTMWDMHEHITSLPLVTEAEARAALAASGLSADAVEAQFARGRRMIAALREARPGDFVIESPTAVGHRNRHGQVVIRKTDTPGTLPLERVYVLQCEYCEYEYGTNGCDVHSRKCPQCQHGREGLPMTGVLE
jgi:hypothetical protein